MLTIYAYQPYLHPSRRSDPQVRIEHLPAVLQGKVLRYRVHESGFMDLLWGAMTANVRFLAASVDVWRGEGGWSGYVERG